jgi:tetratricopeptide (TPR) repeat protein
MKSLIFVFIALIGVNFVVAQPSPKKVQAAAFYKKAVLEESRGQFLQAVTSYKKTMALDKTNDYLKISQNDSAVLLLKKAVQAKPSFLAAHLTLGTIYRDYIRNSEEALAHYTNAYKLDSTNKMTLYSLAWCCNDKGRYRDAIAYCEKALALDNNFKYAYSELGHAFRKLGAYKECIELFRKHLTISVNEQPMYYSGLAYLELNDKAGAEAIYEELKKNNFKSAEGLRKRIDEKQ